MAVKMKVPMPDGTFADGTEIEVDETTERWSEVLLKDGARIRIKATVTSAGRADSGYDVQGNPIYLLNFQPVIAVVSVPDNLKRKPN